MIRSAQNFCALKTCEDHAAFIKDELEAGRRSGIGLMQVSKEAVSFLRFVGPRS